jgi:Ca2+-binding EF-hand superfamily protein
MGGGASKKKNGRGNNSTKSTPVVPFNSDINTNDDSTDYDESSYYIDSETSNNFILQNYLKDVYSAYNITGNGLRPRDLVSMMSDINSYNQEKNDVVNPQDNDDDTSNSTITLDDATYVVNSMDQDNNKVIDLREFVKWIKNGQAKSKKDLETLSNHDPRSKRLVQFLATLLNDLNEHLRRQQGLTGSEITTLQTEDEEKSSNAVGPSSLPTIPNMKIFTTWISDTFCHFDTNGNEKLDKDELYMLCLHIKRWTIKKFAELWNSPSYKNSIYSTALQCLNDFSPRDSSMVLKVLDKHKNGTVNKKDFSLWLSKGFKKNINELNKLMLRSSNTAKMISLVIGFRFCLINTIISKSDLENSLTSLFEQYDKDGDGHLDENELLIMIRGIESTISVTGNVNQQIIEETAALIHGQSTTMTKEDISYILARMDTDGNGTLELPEWLAWLRAGMSRTDEQLNSLPPGRQGVARFIRSLRKYYTINTGKASSRLFFVKNSFEKNVLKLFQKYAKDSEGSQIGQLGPANLLKMMVDLNTKNIESGIFVDGCGQEQPTIDEAKFAINSIDVDGDEEIDTAEFITWINAGASKSNSEMKRLAAKSEMHARLIVFLRNVQKECTKNEDLNDDERDDDLDYTGANFNVDRNTSTVHKTKTNGIRTMGGPLKVRLSQAFTDYDANGDGNIDYTEMLALLIETRSYLPQNIIDEYLNGIVSFFFLNLLSLLIF